MPLIISRACLLGFFFFNHMCCYRHLEFLVGALVVADPNLKAATIVISKIT